MKNKLLAFVFNGIFVCLTGMPAHQAAAVTPGYGNVPNTAARLSGRVLEAGKNEPASFATVALLKTDSTVVNGVSADANGLFEITPVAPGNYLLKVSLMGYETKVVPKVLVPVEAGAVDLGIIYLEPSSQALKEVVVTAEKSMIVTDIDKTTINVGQDLLSTSNNAGELLEKLPAVSMDENGSPMIRGKSNIVVLIDGKPSTLYGNDLATVLQTFPADLIERIDVMTTPSAKYEADGASGVIDIITKKATIVGINGNVRMSAGTYNTHNAGGDVNYKAGKWVLRAAANYQSSEVYNRRTLERLNLAGDRPSTLFQEGTGENKNTNLFGRLSFNYDFNEKNSLGVGINYSRNENRNFSNTGNRTVLADQTLTQQFARINQGWNDGNNVTYSADYRRVFSETDHNFTLAVHYTTGGSDGRSDLEQQSDYDEWKRRQFNRRDNSYNSFYAKADYSWPVTKRLTLETGAHTRQNKRSNDNSLFTFDPLADDFVFDQKLSNLFGYSDALYSGYVTATQKWDQWGLRAGIRLSNMTQHINQISMDRKFSVHFLNMIPSLSFTRKVTESSMFRLNYSRKVQRPQADWLNPFTDVTDPRNIRTGNPDLKPEFVHKAEIGYSNYQDVVGIGASFFTDYSNNAITNLRTIDEQGISYTRFDNVGRELSYGVDSDLSLKFGNKFKVNASGRFFRSEVVSRLAGIDSRRWSYSGNINAFFELPFGLRGSAYMSYEGPRAIAQGWREGVFLANAGIRKHLFEKRAFISVNVQDLFLSRVYRNNLSTSQYRQQSFWKRTNRYMGVTFSYKFGKISAQRRGS